MSAKATGTIWDLKLSVPQRMVLLAMVDHADHDGEHIYAPTPFIAWKTGYSARNVYRIIQDLIDAGILVITGSSRGEANEYKFDFSRAELKEPYRGRKPKTKRRTPDKMSGPTPVKVSGVNTRTPDKMSGGADKMAYPPDKMSAPTPDMLAIDSHDSFISNHDDDDVGDGDRAHAKKRAEETRLIRLLCSLGAGANVMSPTSARQLTARILGGELDEPTTLTSINNMLADGALMGAIINRLRTVPPEKGHPYERQQHRPLQPEPPPHQRDRSPVAPRPRGRHAPTGGSDLKDPGWMDRLIAKAEKGEL